MSIVLTVVSARGAQPASATINPKPANYTSSAVSAESDGSLFWKLSEGRGAMVEFKASLLVSPQKLDVVVGLVAQGKRAIGKDADIAAVETGGGYESRNL